MPRPFSTNGAGYSHAKEHSYILVCVCVKSLSHVQLFATPWTVAFQASPSMGFPRQEYWSGLPFPSPGDLPNPGIEPRSPALEADALTSEPPKLTQNGLKNWTDVKDLSVKLTKEIKGLNLHNLRFVNRSLGMKPNWK